MPLNSIIPKDFPMGDLDHMKELLDVYSWEGERIGQKEKKQFHEEMRKEFFETGKVSIKHKDVKLFLLNSKGNIFLQRRSKWKGDNKGLWDKTIGGHVDSGDTAELTILKECAQELGIPATIVKAEEFAKAVSTTNLSILAILKELEHLDNYQSHRKESSGKEWIEPSITTFYIGYYDGPIWFIDGETCGIQVFSRSELEDEINRRPEDFTEDLKYIFKKYQRLMTPVEKKDQVLND